MATKTGFSSFVLILCCSAFLLIGECVLLSCVRFVFFHATPRDCQNDSSVNLTVSVVVVTESSHELEQTRAQLRDEQQSRKQLQTQLSELSETSAELAAAKHAADTVYLSLHTIRYDTRCCVLICSQKLT